MKQTLIIAFCGLVLSVFIGCVSSVPNATRRTEEHYFTGSGGSGIRLGILVPENSGLSENQGYLPRMVQGALVSNFSRYSDISVLDRVSLDRVISETLDPTYEDNLDIVRLGHVAQVAYMMSGNILRTSVGYVLQINVTDTTASANTIAAYSETHTAAQLNDLSAINRASKELLTQMGVQLTAAAINRLNQASSAQDIGSETNLARGIVAEQKGTIVEALVYYHDAVSFDPRLAEASDRLSSLSSHVSSGNIGENVRNEIQQRNEWMRILAEAEDFFTKNPPFELAYSASLTQGQINYRDEKVVLSTPIILSPTANAFNVLGNIAAGLEATGRRQQWGWTYWPLLTIRSEDRRSYYDNYVGIFEMGRNSDSQTIAQKNMDIKAFLLNENGTVISKTEMRLVSVVSFCTVGKGHSSSEMQQIKSGLSRSEYDRFIRGGLSRSEHDRLTAKWGQNQNTGIWIENMDSPEYRTGSGWFLVDTTQIKATESKGTLNFSVNASDITDKMTIQIASLNGVNMAENPNFIRITSR